MAPAFHLTISPGPFQPGHFSRAISAGPFQPRDAERRDKAHGGQKGKGPTKAAPAERFTGDVWLEVLVPPTSGPGLEVFSVHFPPGARTAWHSHPVGQVLLVTDGSGLVQSRGGVAEHIHTGDTVVVEAGEWHWHGAGPQTYMTHVAVQGAGPDGSTSDWGEHVSDDEYPTG